MIGSAV
ncbi:hypothetical protein VCHENC02_3322, partial [Vibrio harveyi]